MTPSPIGDVRALLRDLPYAVCIFPLLRRLITNHTLGRRCEHCAAAVWPAACLPPARCPGCRRSVGPRPYVVELAATASFLLLIFSGARGWELAAHTTWAMILTVLGLIDAAVHRLPHELTGAATLGLVTFLVPVGGTVATWLTALAAAAGLAAFHAALHAAAPSGLGVGDVTMTIPVGLALGWLDWRYPVAAVLLAHVMTFLTLSVMRISERPSRQQPFGSYLTPTSICLVAVAHATG